MQLNARPVGKKLKSMTHPSPLPPTSLPVLVRGHSQLLFFFCDYSYLPQICVLMLPVVPLFLLAHNCVRKEWAGVSQVSFSSDKMTPCPQGSEKELKEEELDLVTQHVLVTDFGRG